MGQEQQRKEQHPQQVQGHWNFQVGDSVSEDVSGSTVVAVPTEPVVSSEEVGNSVSDAEDVCGSVVVGVARGELVASSEVGNSVSEVASVLSETVGELISTLVGVSIEVSSVEDVSAPVEVKMATDESDADVTSEVRPSELVVIPLSVAEVSGASEDVTGPDELVPSDKLLVAESLEVSRGVSDVEVSGRTSDVAEDVPK
ncbi:hypothetical protein HG530_005649 [Fusarium avenaceum]|nr:hypothetical protein HG530_005649 [Fusarium avenaceum]